MKVVANSRQNDRELASKLGIKKKKKKSRLKCCAIGLLGEIHEMMSLNPSFLDADPITLRRSQIYTTNKINNIFMYLIKENFTRAELVLSIQQ